MSIIIFALTAIGAYLLGSVPAAYLVARWVRGIDLRQYGSGNVGASNVVTVVSKRWGIAVIVFDMVKGMAAVYAAQSLGLSIGLQALVGLAVISGHNWSIFLGFSSGRGGLTTAGVAIALAPPLGLSALAFGLILGLFHHLALGMILAIAALPICGWFLSQPLGIKEPLPLSLGFLAIFLITVIRRLSVPRAAIAASVSTKELLVNRLLFDRDIRDRKTWIHRTPVETKPNNTPKEGTD